MPRGSKVAKKKRAVESIHDRDRIIIRLPDGMRDRLSGLAEANGRSVTAEAVAAIEEHLKGANRFLEMWEFFERHRAEIADITLLRLAIENLEIYARNQGQGFRGGLVARREHNEREARIQLLPKLTEEQATKVRALMAEREVDEQRLLRYLKAPSIEEIRGFDRAVSAILIGAKKDPPERPD
jgi:predicted DNA-binding protein